MDATNIAAITNRSQTDPLPREFCDVAEAADFLRISKASIRRFLRDKQLKRYRAGNRVLLRIAELRAFVAGEKT